MQGKIICITNRHLVEGDYLMQMERIAKAKVDAIILREKDISPKEYQALAQEMKQICEQYEVKLVLHFFGEIARKQEAKYFHFTGEQLRGENYWEIRKDWSNFAYEPQIGMGVHSKEEAKLAKEYHMDYALVSHIFPTDCKKGIPQKGVDFLSEMKKELSIPGYALGGIHLLNARECIRNGADGVCMMSDFMKTKDPKVLVNALRNL